MVVFLGGFSSVRLEPAAHWVLASHSCDAGTRTGETAWLVRRKQVESARLVSERRRSAPEWPVMRLILSLKCLVSHAIRSIRAEA